MKKVVYVRNIPIGDGKVTVQSMTNTDTRDVNATVAQIKSLADAGADFVRVSIPDRESSEAIKDVVRLSPVPVIGDIHFSAEPALIAIQNGIDKIRINPSNVPEEGLKKIVEACKERKIPIRVGVNKFVVPQTLDCFCG